MVMQRIALFIALTLLGALFLGLLACGPAAPQDNEPAFTGVTAFPKADATEEPTEEPKDATEVPEETPTPTPTPTPMPTVCLTYEQPDGTIGEMCRVRPTSVPVEYRQLPGLLGQYALEYKIAQEAPEGSAARQQAERIVEVQIWPPEPFTAAGVEALKALLESHDIPYYTHPDPTGQDPYDVLFNARVPASLLLTLNQDPAMGYMQTPRRVVLPD